MTNINCFNLNEEEKFCLVNLKKNIIFYWIEKPLTARNVTILNIQHYFRWNDNNKFTLTRSDIQNLKISHSELFKKLNLKEIQLKEINNLKEIYEIIT